MLGFFILCVVGCIVIGVPFTLWYWKQADKWAESERQRNEQRRQAHERSEAPERPGGP